MFEFLVKLTINPVWILASKDGVSVTLLVANICWPGMSKLEAYYNFAALALAHEWRICFERRNDSFTNVVTKTLSKRYKKYIWMTFRHTWILHSTEHCIEGVIHKSPGKYFWDFYHMTCNLRLVLFMEMCFQRDLNTYLAYCHCA